MILYYAIGGGLGHVTRARAVVHTLAISEPVTILTPTLHYPVNNSLFLNSTLNTQHLTLPEPLSNDLTAYHAWLRSTLDELAPHSIYIDAFPAGILGEFCGFDFADDIELICVARLLRWNEYAKVITEKPPRFAHTYCIEQLTPEHETFVHHQSDHVEFLELRDPPVGIDEAMLAQTVASLRKGDRQLWLIVHSGPDDEVEELVAYARESAEVQGVDPHLILVAPSRPASLASDIAHLDFYPASALYPYVDCIVTACGFNAMRQTAPWRDRHLCLPFPRRYDDQFLRKERNRSLGQSHLSSKRQ